MRTKILTILAVCALTGALSGLVVGGGAAGAATQLNLNNATAETGTDCPDTINDYWHFVLTPNNGSLAFVTITLNLDGTTKSFPADGPIIPRGPQQDNVFARAPTDFPPAPLETSGSSAEGGGRVEGNRNFNLPHVW